MSAMSPSTVGAQRQVPTQRRHNVAWVAQDCRLAGRRGASGVEPQVQERLELAVAGIETVGDANHDHAVDPAGRDRGWLAVQVIGME